MVQPLFWCLPLETPLGSTSNYTILFINIVGFNPSWKGLDHTCKSKFQGYTCCTWIIREKWSNFYVAHLPQLAKGTSPNPRETHIFLIHKHRLPKYGNKSATPYFITLWLLRCTTLGLSFFPCALVYWIGTFLLSSPFLWCLSH